MTEAIQLAIPLGIILSFLPGAAFFVLLETSASKGFRAGVSFDLGVVLADVVFILIAYFSSYQLLSNLSNQPGLYVFGGFILSAYGIILFRNHEIAKERYQEFTDSYVGLFIKGFILNFVNVGVLVFWLGVLLWVGPALDGKTRHIASFFGILIGTYFTVDLGKIIAAKQLKRKLTRERTILLRKIVGIILVICGIALVVQGFLPKHSFDPITAPAGLQ